jgi:hypothetical protein
MVKFSGPLRPGESRRTLRTRKPKRKRRKRAIVSKEILNYARSRTKLGRDSRSVWRDRLLDKSIIRKAGLIASKAGRKHITVTDIRTAMFQLSGSGKARTGKQGGGSKSAQNKRLLRELNAGLKRNYF